MRKAVLSIAFSSLIILTSILAAVAQERLNSRLRNDIFVIKSITQITAAEYTYSATTGNGDFATLGNLPYIDTQLASGEKYGYRFAVSITNYSPGVPSSFRVTATPIRYPKTGRRSFFADITGDLHGADKNGAAANADDPYIDSCAFYGPNDNERCTVAAVRTLHGAEMTYAATVGNSLYGSLRQLGDAQLVAPHLSTGNIHEYKFTITTEPASTESSAAFRVFAVPRTYGVTGFLSYFIGTDGVIHAADKHGLPADEDDPVL